jgi:DNA-binding NarL/FixJ family response regulator
MRVLIAEDNKLVRRDFVGLLAADKEFEVCGEASDSSETLKKVAELRPDLILLDVSMPGTNGLNTARILRQQFPALKILIISQHDSSQLLPRSLEAGAHGCIEKGANRYRLTSNKEICLRTNPFRVCDLTRLSLSRTNDGLTEIYARPEVAF